MVQELIYTSAPKGLQPGTCGFCTVAATAGMPRNLAAQLESLSGYRHVFGPHDENTGLNPVAYSQLIVAFGNESYHVLSRVSDAGLDYTRRSNKLACHLVLEKTDLPAAGPAWLLAQPGVIIDHWEGEPRPLPVDRPLPQGSSAARVCRVWEQVTGDAGWAGVLAESAASPSIRYAVILFKPGMDTLALVDEALALLPPSLRWGVTFSTYFTKLPPGIDCKWRFILEGSPQAKAIRPSAQVLVIDLCQPAAAPPQGAFVDAARSGKAIDLSPVTLQEPSGDEKAPTRQPVASPVYAIQRERPAAQAARGTAADWAPEASIASVTSRPRRPKRTMVFSTAIVGVLSIAGAVAFAFFGPQLVNQHSERRDNVSVFPASPIPDTRAASKPKVDELIEEATDCVTLIEEATDCVTWARTSAKRAANAATQAQQYHKDFRGALAAAEAIYSEIQTGADLKNSRSLLEEMKSECTRARDCYKQSQTYVKQGNRAITKARSDRTKADTKLAEAQKEIGQLRLKKAAGISDLEVRVQNARQKLPTPSEVLESDQIIKGIPKDKDLGAVTKLEQNLASLQEQSREPTVDVPIIPAEALHNLPASVRDKQQRVPLREAVSETCTLKVMGNYPLLLEKQILIRAFPAAEKTGKSGEGGVHIKWSLSGDSSLPKPQPDEAVLKHSAEDVEATQRLLLDDDKQLGGYVLRVTSALGKPTQEGVCDLTIKAWIEKASGELQADTPAKIRIKEIMGKLMDKLTDLDKKIHNEDYYVNDFAKQIAKNTKRIGDLQKKLEDPKVERQSFDVLTVTNLKNTNEALNFQREKREQSRVTYLQQVTSLARLKQMLQQLQEKGYDMDGEVFVDYNDGHKLTLVHLGPSAQQ